MDILERIAPKKIANFVGNKLVTKKCCDILSNPKHPTKVLGLVGPDGCGKTTLAELLFRQYDMDVLSISKDNYNSKETFASMQTFCKNRTIDSFFQKKRKIIFVDDLDVLVAIDRCAMSNLLGVVQDLCRANVFMLICCNIREEKRLSEFKKDIEVLQVTYPSVKDTFVYLLQAELCDNEEELLKVVQFYRGNVRDTVLNLKMGNAHDFRKNNFKDMNQFEVVQKLYQDGCAFEDIRFLINDDVSVLAFLLYENLPEELHNNRAEKDIISPYLQTNAHFLSSCQLENFIYDFGIWNFFDIINLVRLIAVIALLNEMPRKKTAKWTKFRFSQVLSKVSHRNMMRKRMKQVQAQNGWSQETMFLAADMMCADGVKSKGASDWSNFSNTYEKYFC